MGLTHVQSMKITPSEFVGGQVVGLETEILRELRGIRMDLVNECRSYNTYQDHTSNLRSSIGGFVVANGKLDSMSNFEQLPPKDKNNTKNVKYNGGEQGRSYAKDLADREQKNLIVGIVAGMQYAAAVESKGYDVISGSSILADRLVKETLKDIAENR